MLWIAVILMTLRSISVVLFPMSGEEDPVPLRGEELVGVIQPLAVIVGFALGWAILWTTYFKRSVRVRNTFRPETAEAPGNG